VGIGRRTVYDWAAQDALFADNHVRPRQLGSVGFVSPDRKRCARKAESAIASSRLIKPSTNDNGKAGTGNGPTVTGLEAVLLALFGSPPPDTAAMFVTVPGATLAPTLVVTMIAG
jgi:hypothetical protein